MKARLQTYLRWILPVIFILYLGEIVSFTHVHIVNGVTIVHSHPSQDQDGQHKHSLQELQLFHSLSTIVVEDGVKSLFSESNLSLKSQSIEYVIAVFSEL